MEARTKENYLYSDNEIEDKKNKIKLTVRLTILWIVYIILATIWFMFSGMLSDNGNHDFLILFINLIPLSIIIIVTRYTIKKNNPEVPLFLLFLSFMPSIIISFLIEWIIIKIKT